MAGCDPISRGDYAQKNHLLEIGANTFYNKFDCRRHCSLPLKQPAYVTISTIPQTLNADNLSPRINRVFGLNNLPNSLMDPFMTIIRTILLDDVFRMPYREQYQMIQTLRSDGFDKAFRIAIQIRTSGWKLHGFYT